MIKKFLTLCFLMRYSKDGKLQTSLAGETKYSDTGLLAGTYYEYLVKAFDNASNESGPSNTISVGTLSTGVENVNHSHGELIVYPNPSEGQVFVSLPNTSDSEVCFELYSATGLKIWSEKFHTGTNQSEFSFDISNLTNGLYVYRCIGT